MRAGVRSREYHGRRRSVFIALPSRAFPGGLVQVRDRVRGVG